MKPKTTVAQQPLKEHQLKKAWETSAPEPSPATMALVKQRIQRETEQQAHAVPTPRVMYFWRPILAAAASLAILAGAYMQGKSGHTTPNDTWQEVVAMEYEIHAELDALEATVWDALAELEEDAPTNDFLLQALTLQMTMWEEQ